MADEVKTDTQAYLVLGYCPEHRALTIEPTPSLIAVIEDTGDVPDAVKEDCIAALNSWVHLVFTRHGLEP